MKVLVLMGGTSAEREVSLRSGAAVLEGLRKAGHEAQALDFSRDIIAEMINMHPEVVFIALHGKPGEDGTVQGLLDLLAIPYTGSNLTASAICIDKVLTKKMLHLEGIPTAQYEIIGHKRYQEDPEGTCTVLVRSLGLPMVVKPPTQGSSIGTMIVRDEKQIALALEQAFAYDSNLLIEAYIPGSEVTVAVLGNNDLQVLPIIEITSANEFYDYSSKYTQGMCEHIIPARISSDVQQKVEEIAVDTYRLLGCRGYARIDFRIDEAGQPYVLEVNTNPGMTEMSLVPDAARSAGMSFEDLVDRIVNLAVEK